MHLFTIKDLLLHNTPCICCGGKTDFRWNIISDTGAQSITPFELEPSGTLRFSLQIKYKSKLSVSVNPTTNAYQVIAQPADPNQLSTFLETRGIYCSIRCTKCRADILSDKLSFEEGHIAPVSLIHEILYLREGARSYTLTTLFRSGNTVLELKVDDPTNPTFHHWKLPLMPRSHFKDRAHLLSRLKTCTLFG